MKSNPSPSAPLNLCAPVGVSGVTLPDSPLLTLDFAYPPASPVESLPYWEADGPGEEIKFAAVDSVGVPAPLPTFVEIHAGTKDGEKNGGATSNVQPDGKIKIWNEMDLLLCESPAFIVSACASHAAKDAKIQALTEALENALFLISEHADHLAKQAHPDEINKVCDDGSAALALPTAPRSDS